MTMLYPIVLETEDSGAVSAYVPGLPVYAAAETHAKAERAIRAVLTEYLNTHPTSRPDARVRVARFSDSGKKVDIVGVAALVGAHRSATKARASRTNGPLGGRPRKTEAARPRQRRRADPVGLRTGRAYAKMWLYRELAGHAAASGVPGPMMAQKRSCGSMTCRALRRCVD
jgi:predicted RNase H-like HicB family nuclease